VAVANDRLIDVVMSLSLNVWSATKQIKPDMFIRNVDTLDDVSTGTKFPGKTALHQVYFLSNR
jgi:hypothetical protein